MTRKIDDTKIEAVYNALRRAAKNNQPCPTNGEIMRLIGCRSRATPTRILQLLTVTRGLCVTPYHMGRLVSFPDGLKTATPAVVAPHWSKNRSKAPGPSKQRPGETDRERRERQYAEYLKRQKEIEALRTVPRDPCPKCGIRGDIGCVHQRWAA